MEKKTAYEWCLENNMRILSGLEVFGGEDGYMCDILTQNEFSLLLCNGVKIKQNSTPRKPEKYLELRMFGFVPYNISKEQIGIQFDHAKDEYQIMFGSDKDYQNYIREWKTVIILNGGTSNEGTMVRQGFKTSLYVGTMQKHLQTLLENGVKVATFYEPDLNSMLSGMAFLVDERVFNKVLYPDFKSQPYPWLEKNRNAKPTDKEREEWEAENNKNYAKWLEKVGGEKNAFLREFLRDKRLA